MTRPITRLPPAALAISGSDPSGGAGLEADLKVFHHHGVFGMAIPTLLTAQNAEEMREIRHLDPSFATRQWRALFGGRRPAAIKIGALGARGMVKALRSRLQSPEARGIPVVLDPVLSASAGPALLEPDALPDLKKLFPYCRLVTPNVPEFSRLCGEEVDGANAERLLRAYMRGQSFALLLKGGHLESVRSVDLLWEKGRILRLEGPRLAGAHAHGTGCALASAIAANLALGHSLPAACRRAKAYVHRALRGPRAAHILDFWARI